MSSIFKLDTGLDFRTSQMHILWSYEQEAKLFSFIDEKS